MSAAPSRDREPAVGLVAAVATVVLAGCVFWPAFVAMVIWLLLA